MRSVRLLSTLKLGEQYARSSPPPFRDLVALQRQSCDIFADKHVFGYKKGEGYHWITYRELARRVNHYEGLLRGQGVLPGDKIALICGNRPAWAAAAFASARLGAAIVPMYEAQKPADWHYILQDSGARIAFASAATAPVCLEWQKQGFLSHVFQLDKEGDPSNLAYLDWDRFSLESKAASERDCRPVDLDETVTLIYTSGTTGKPKGVELTHRNITSNVLALSKIGAGRYGSRHVHFSFLPWAHVYGQTVELFMGLYHGAALGLAASNKTLLDDIATVRPTVLVAVPTLFQRIYNGVLNKITSSSPMAQRTFKWAMHIAEDRRNALDNAQRSAVLAVQWNLAQQLVFSHIKARFGGRLEYAMTGGASLQKDIQVFFADIGIPILEGYGLTETSPVIASERWGPTEKLQGGLQAVEGVKIYITDPETDKPLPPNAEGEICVVGPNVMKGYYKNPKATAQTFTTIEGQRAFRTGDRGRLDEKGVLTITGRIKEQYKLANGKFVVPGVVENALMNSRYIQQAFIYGRDRMHNVALLVPDAAQLSAELEAHNSEPHHDPADVLRTHPQEVRQLLEQAVNAANCSPEVKNYERIAAFHTVTEPFSLDNGLLTPKLSMKRNVIEATYGKVLEELYATLKE